MCFKKKKGKIKQGLFLRSWGWLWSHWVIFTRSFPLESQVYLPSSPFPGP